LVHSLYYKIFFIYPQVDKLLKFLIVLVIILASFNKWFYNKLLNIGQNNFNGVAYMEINSEIVQITKVIDNTDDNVVKFEYTTPQEKIDEHYFIFKTNVFKHIFTKYNKIFIFFNHLHIHHKLLYIFPHAFLLNF